MALPARRCFELYLLSALHNATRSAALPVLQNFWLLHGVAFVGVLLYNKQQEPFIYWTSLGAVGIIHDALPSKFH